MKLMIAGGGTGGHVLAGISVAEAWVAAQPGAEVLFIGAKGGLESRLVPQYGYPLRLLKMGSLNRVSYSVKIKTFILLPWAFLKAIYYILSMRPNCVLGVGGYASGPVVLIAAILKPLLGCKVALLEQNVVPGFTNRILGKWVERIYCAFPVHGDWAIKFQSKILITGNPIRKKMRPLPPADPKSFTLFIFGGSQGAVGLNTLVLQVVEKLFQKGHRFKIIHQTGDLDFNRVQEAHIRLNTGAHVVRFIDNMEEAYLRASIIVCRAGSSTLSELAAVKRAAIFVPLPTASDDHQTKNAELFTSAGAARIVQQTQATEMIQLIEEAIRNPAFIRSQEEKVSCFYRPNAAKEIVGDLRA